MSVSKMRRENLKHLADSRTQTKLASDLEHETLTQQIISSIIRGKRMLHDSEARYVEGKLGSMPFRVEPFDFKGRRQVGHRAAQADARACCR